MDLPGIYRGPVGTPVPFRNGPLAGYIAPHAVFVPMSGGTDEVTVTMAAWWGGLGGTFYEALARSVGLTGQSDPVTVRPDTNPGAPPADLVGLQPCSIWGIF